MTSFHHVMISTCENWFQTNPLKHELDDRADNTVSSVCVLPVVKIWHFSSKFDHHLSLHCGSTKPKFKTGLLYWFLWESCELRFPEFTDNFGTDSSNIHLNAVQFLSHWHNMERNDAFSLFAPVSMKTWHLHTLWRFTVPAYSLIF